MDRLYLTYDWNKDHGAYIGVITDKHPRKGRGRITVLSVEKAATVAEIQAWFEEEERTRPWEIRQ